MLGRVRYEKDPGAVIDASPALHIRYRQQFPVTQNLIYLNHAAVAPIPRVCADAMSRLTEDACLFGSLHYEEWMEAYSGLRNSVAKLIHASADEIAIVKNTSEGISTVALGMDWRAGDRVVAFREEFPANFYPWLRLESKGVRLTWLSIYDPIEKIAEAVDGARLLAISYVNYLSGYRVDLRAIGELCHAHGCFFLVDAIQGMGAYPIDVEAHRIDALAADGHKWMLGPEGNGVLYVRREWQDRIEPAEFGWMNTAKYTDYGLRDLTLRPNAGRYECGTLNTAGCFGHRASVDLLLEAGVENVREAVDSLAQQIEDGVRSKGYEVMLARSAENGSGIVSFRHPNKECRVVVSELKRNQILAASRQGWVRTAPHFYISPDDIDQMLSVLPAV